MISISITNMVAINCVNAGVDPGFPKSVAEGCASQTGEVHRRNWRTAQTISWKALVQPWFHLGDESGHQVKLQKPSRVYNTSGEFPRKHWISENQELALLGNSGKTVEVRFQLSFLWLYYNYVLFRFYVLEPSTVIWQWDSNKPPVVTCILSNCLAFCLTLISKYHKSQKSAISQRTFIPASVPPHPGHRSACVKGVFVHTPCPLLHYACVYWSLIRNLSMDWPHFEIF